MENLTHDTLNPFGATDSSQTQMHTFPDQFLQFCTRLETNYKSNVFKLLFYKTKFVL